MSKTWIQRVQRKLSRASKGPGPQHYQCKTSDSGDERVTVVDLKTKRPGYPEEQRLMECLECVEKVSFTNHVASDNDNMGRWIKFLNRNESHSMREYVATTEGKAQQVGRAGTASYLCI